MRKGSHDAFVAHPERAERAAETERQLERKERLLLNANAVLTDYRNGLETPETFSSAEQLRDAEVLVATYALTLRLRDTREDPLALQIPDNALALNEQANESGITRDLKQAIDGLLLKNALAKGSGKQGRVTITDALLNALQKRQTFLREVVVWGEERSLTLEEADGFLAQARETQQRLACEIAGDHVPKALDEFSPSIQTTLLAEMAYVELTEGCSVGCSFCAYSAKKGVQGSMPFDEAAWYAARWNGKALLYHATDPFDFRDEKNPEQGYPEIVRLAEMASGTVPYTSTAYPKNSRDMLRRMEDRVDRISVSHMNVNDLLKQGVFAERGEGMLLPALPDLLESSLLGPLGKASPVEARLRTNESSGSTLPESVAFAPLFSGGTTNYYLGLQVHLDPHDPALLQSGRQTVQIRRHQPNQLKEYAGTIHSGTGVFLDRHRVYNSIPTLTSPKYENGFHNEEINQRQLVGGETTMQRLKEDWAEGKEVDVNQLLQNGIVMQQTKNAALMNYTPESQPEKMCHRISIKTFDETAKEVGLWECEFDMFTGRVLELTRAKSPSSI